MFVHSVGARGDQNAVSPDDIYRNIYIEGAAAERLCGLAPACPIH